MSDIVEDTTEVTDAPASTPAADTAPAATEAPAPAETPVTDTPEPAPKKDWRETRIAQLTARNAALIREAEAARALAASKPEGERPVELSEAEVERRAEAKVAQRELAAKIDAWAAKGHAEFKDFNDRCDTVAGLGLSPREKPEFMSCIADMDDGHKIVAHLAENPDVALQLAKEPVHKMAMSLARLSSKLSTPVRQSRAPEPVTPVGVSVSSDPDIYDPKMSMEAFAAHFKKTSPLMKGRR